MDTDRKTICAATAVLCVLGLGTIASAGVQQFATCQAAHTLAPLLHEVVPAVVNIAVKGSIKEDNPLYKDLFFRQFLHVPKQLEREFQAAGSGVIVDADHGYVLTNNHVVENASEIKVTTKDGRTLDASLVGLELGVERSGTALKVTLEIAPQPEASAPKSKNE
jgi:serine protease Do